MAADIHSPSQVALYIHIPFCVKKCRYCDFYSLPGHKELLAEYLEALSEEWELVKDYFSLHHATISSLYFGGGTPSLIPEHLWEKYLTPFIGRLALLKDAEITLECNPESFSDTKARHWFDSGVNRLSCGIQSLIPRELQLLGRPHTVRLAQEMLASSALRLFSDLSVDIMYGIPGQTIESFASTTEKILTHSQIKHISAYELSIHDHTPFGRHRYRLPLPPEESVVEMSRILANRCAAHSIVQYEVSNYAVPGHESRHNSSYWNYTPYIGLGPGAHSWIHSHRFGNIPELTTYIHQIRQQKMPRAFAERLTLDMMRTEYIMLGLRTVKGVDTDRFKRITGSNLLTEQQEQKVQELVKGEFLHKDKTGIKPTSKGLLFADALAVQLSL